jgi:hypothetical protein
MAKNYEINLTNGDTFVIESASNEQAILASAQLAYGKDKVINVTPVVRDENQLTYIVANIILLVIGIPLCFWYFN